MSSDQRTTSPRSNVRRVLEESGAVHGGDDVALREALALLSTADAENKRKNRKLYLLLDLDETLIVCLLYTSPSPRDQRGSRMPSSA